MLIYLIIISGIILIYKLQDYSIIIVIMAIKCEVQHGNYIFVRNIIRYNERNTI